MRYSLVYGGLAGIIIIAVSTAFVSAGLLGHSSWPVMGYLAMLVGLTMIFVGVKRYRDVEGGGVITFGKALAVGLGISLIAAILYAAAFEVYAAMSGFDLTAHFSEITTREMRAAGAAPAAIERSSRLCASSGRCTAIRWCASRSTSWRSGRSACSSRWYPPRSCVTRECCPRAPAETGSGRRDGRGVAGA